MGLNLMVDLALVFLKRANVLVHGPNLVSNATDSLGLGGLGSRGQQGGCRLNIELPTRAETHSRKDALEEANDKGHFDFVSLVLCRVETQLNFFVEIQFSELKIKDFKESKISKNFKNEDNR